MIAGHFGFAAAVKARVPTAPTWALMLASVWLDVIFVPLFLTGVETMAPFGAGDGKGYGAAVIHADLTHSLVGASILALLFGAVSALRWGKTVGAVLGATVLSHWVLDLPMHHHDLPLLPGNAGRLPLLGLGLWSWPIGAATLELAFVVGGAFLYWRAARAAAAQAATGTRSADLAGLAILSSGIVTLALNLAGA